MAFVLCLVCVALAGLEFRESPASASWVLGIKGVGNYYLAHAVLLFYWKAFYYYINSKTVGPQKQ